MKQIVLCLAVTSSLVACGIPKEEHQKTLDQLAKTQEDLAAEKAAREKTSKEMGGRVTALETENKKLGGELTNVSNKAVSLEQDASAAKGELAATRAELEALRKQREQAEKRLKAFREVAAKLKAMVDSGKIQVQIRKGRMLVKLPDNILFPSGSATLKKEGKTALEEVAKALKDIKDRDFVVAGHTDNVAIKTAKFPSNWELSTQRAVEVVKFLGDAGMDETKLSAAGYGSTDPIAPNDTAENKQQNRRLEIIVMPNIEELPKFDDAG
jgi:chemotaxis protein MotB